MRETSWPVLIGEEFSCKISGYFSIVDLNILKLYASIERAGDSSGGGLRYYFLENNTQALRSV